MAILFEEIHAVAGFFEKTSEPMSILLGLKRRGYGAGCLMPTGGHYEEVDRKNPVSAAQREGGEESGLHGRSNMVVAKIVVTIVGKNKKLFIDVVVFTDWSGKIKDLGPDDEFEPGTLKFYKYTEIPWDLMLPGEKEWMDKVFLKHEPCLVEILCGIGRHDVINTRLLPFPKPE